tara:strand:- start:3908 stop:5665 length:1758 start_codon:yes stop_codon:yes gene_type:complete
MILLFLVGAGARLFIEGRGSSHPPTAVVLIVDNSMSSALIYGESRVLDELKEIAVTTLEASSAEDQFWVLRAGEPWLPSFPGGASEARAIVEDIETSDARGDLAGSLERAAGILRTAPFEHREIHLISDLQASAFPARGESPAGDIPVVVWSSRENLVQNRAITRVSVGGGLPPLEGDKTEITVYALENPNDTTPLSIRLIVNEQIRGVTQVPPGSASATTLAANASGWIRGYVDADPDALRTDDRRYFAYRSRPAPRVATTGDIGLFAAEAISVLESADRLRSVSPREAEVLITGMGVSLDILPLGASVLVTPPADPTLLPGLNRRLANEGIPWRYSARPRTGSAILEGRDLPNPLENIRVERWYDLELSNDLETPSRTLAEVSNDPWAIQGTDLRGRHYLLVASALDVSSTSLPVSTGMVRFIDWVVNEWTGTGVGQTDYEAGDELSAPRGATHVRFPYGEEFEIDGTRVVRGTNEVGFYDFLNSDTLIDVVALNSPITESRLEKLSPEDILAHIGERARPVSDRTEWSREVFGQRQGPELWWPLILVTILLLVIESLVASAGQIDTGVTRSTKTSSNPALDA